MNRLTLITIGAASLAIGAAVYIINKRNEKMIKKISFDLEKIYKTEKTGIFI